MTSDMNQPTGDPALIRLKTASLYGLLVGAAGSVAFTLYAGRLNESILLKGLFSAWVLSPFAILFLAGRFSKNWAVAARMVLYLATLLLALSSLIIYGFHILEPPKTPSAFVFVVVPPLSALLAVLALLISRRLSK